MKSRRHSGEYLTRFERKLMGGTGLREVRQLNKLLAAPISQDAAMYSEPPDEEYSLADRMYEEADRQGNAQKEFSALFEGNYLN